MKSLNRGVGFYTKGSLTKIINFPNGDICCGWCPYHNIKTINGHTRVICVKTNEALEDIHYKIGTDCPLIFEEGSDDLSESRF